MISELAVVVTTRNEEGNVGKCLRSVSGWVDQVFVIDSENTDRTVEIAREYAEVVTLPYEEGKIIPWIFQWGLEHLPFRNEWVLILEADQEVTPELRRELQTLLARKDIQESGFYIRRKQMFRGKWIRHGGYGSKYLLKLFRRSVSRLDPEEEDTRVYVDGRTAKLGAWLVEDNAKEREILFYLEKHIRYARAFAREEQRRRKSGMQFKTQPRFPGTPDQKVLWMKSIYYRLPLYIRPALYFFYRYFILLGFLDGKTGFVFHFLQSFWFRLVVDVRLEELLKSEAHPAERMTES
ncbi:MAG: glycosyltransferase family 2 protein [Acidobacteriota bacterium]